MFPIFKFRRIKITHYRPTELKINLDQIVKNYNVLANLSRNDFVCPMLKANAYGHGAVEVGRRLEAEGCKNFGVALYEEAIELRAAGLEMSQILVFAPLTAGCIQLADKHSLTPVILSDGDLEILKSETISKKINVCISKLNFRNESVWVLEQKIAKELI